MESKKGIVSKIKILQLNRQPLVYFKLDTSSCLIAHHSLNFLADVDDGMTLVIAGYYNKKRQFIVRKYAVVGKTKIMLSFEKNFFHHSS